MELCVLRREGAASGSQPRKTKPHLDLRGLSRGCDRSTLIALGFNRGGALHDGANFTHLKSTR